MIDVTFSIIVPMYNVEAFVRPCLVSVAEQMAPGDELIAIDDASTDRSLDIARRVAEQFPGIRIIALPENRGLGPARNCGFEAAAGSYTLFVDGDDELAPDSLAHLRKRLTEDPVDVVIFDYERRYWDGRAIRNTRQDLLERAILNPEPFTASEHPELLELLQVVWNKAYRTEFLRDEGLVHPDGYYEDTPFTYPVMLSARSVVVEGRVLYRYRQRRSGNILGTQSRKHFDIFLQFDRVFGWLEEREDLLDWAPFLVGRMTAHFTTILGKEERLSPEDRQEFFYAAAEICRTRWQRYGYEPPAEHDAELQRVLHAGVYEKYLDLLRSRREQRAKRVAKDRPLPQGLVRAVQRLGSTKRSTRRLAWRWKTRAQMALYRRWQEQPIDHNLAVFSAYWFRGYSCNPAAICDELGRQAPSISRVWIAKDPATSGAPQGVKVVRPHTFAYFRVLARAGLLVNNVNFPNHYVKRPGTTFLQTHHGTPIKTMGVEVRRTKSVAAHRREMEQLLERSDKWDLVLSSNRHSTEVWKRSFPVEADVIETGYPRNDRLVNVAAEDRSSARRELGIDEGAHVVLYMPTFRNYARVHYDVPSLRHLVEFLPSDTVLLVRDHYFKKGFAVDPACRSRIREVSDVADVNSLFIAADVLLSDFSSAIVDFSLLGKPIVLYLPDLKRYERTRGLAFDLLAQPPGPIAREPRELTRILRDRTYLGASAERVRESFARDMNEFEDGGASKRVVSTLLARHFGDVTP